MKNVKHLQAARNGFTIVELLSVIAVIGILASVTIVAYRGVTQRSVNSQLMSDINNAADQLELDYMTPRLYPATAAEVNGNQGFKTSPGTTIIYTPSGDRQSYCLQVSSTKPGTKTYKRIQEGTLQEGTC